MSIYVCGWDITLCCDCYGFFNESEKRRKKKILKSTWLESSVLFLSCIFFSPHTASGAVAFVCVGGIRRYISCAWSCSYSDTQRIYHALRRYLPLPSILAAPISSYANVVLVHVSVSERTSEGENEQLLKKIRT